MVTWAAGDIFEVASRPVTPVGTALVLLLTAVLAIIVTRSYWSFAVAAFAGAYAARRIGLDTGFIKWLDHQVLERLSETFDNIEGWLIAFMVCSALLRLLRERPSARREIG